MDDDNYTILSSGIRASTTYLDDGYVLNVEHSTASNIAGQMSTHASFSPCTISLYVLRQADLNDTWTIQAVFDNDITYIFKRVEFLTRPKVNLLNVVDVKYNHFLFRISHRKLNKVLLYTKFDCLFS
jgi:hypothetical protein